MLQILGSSERIPKIRVAEFKDPNWGDKVNSGIGLSYWAARLHTKAARHDNPMPELTLSPESGSLNSFGNSAGIFKQYVRARNRVGIKLSYRPARLHRLDELIPRSRFLGSLKV
jgi:hypothetical protein